MEIVCSSDYREKPELERVMKDFSNVCDEVTSCVDSYCTDEKDPTCKQHCCALYPCAGMCKSKSEKVNITVKVK